MSIGDKVLTPDGKGVIVEVENFKHPRYGVKLDKVPERLWLYGLKFIYYWEKEIKKI